MKLSFVFAHRPISQLESCSSRQLDSRSPLRLILYRMTAESEVVARLLGDVDLGDFVAEHIVGNE